MDDAAGRQLVRCCGQSHATAADSPTSRKTTALDAAGFTAVGNVLRTGCGSTLFDEGEGCVVAEAAVSVLPWTSPQDGRTNGTRLR